MNKNALQDVSFTPLKWQEGVEFARRRYGKHGPGTTLTFKLSMLIISFLFCFFLWAVSGFLANLIIVILSAISLSLVLAFAIKAASRAPRRVSLTERVAVIDNERIDYGELLSVRLGCVQYDEIDYPVASFVLKSGREKIIGLPDAGYFRRLEESLGVKGVRVETSPFKVTF